MAEIAHTSSAFEKDLDDLSLNLARLGMLASRQLNACLRAMSDFQASRVDMVIEQDSELDLLEAQVNEMVLSIITMGDLIAYLEEGGEAPEGALEAMHEYRAEYGV